MFSVKHLVLKLSVMCEMYFCVCSHIWCLWCIFGRTK